MCRLLHEATNRLTVHKLQNVVICYFHSNKICKKLSSLDERRVEISTTLAISDDFKPNTQSNKLPTKEEECLTVPQNERDFMTNDSMILSFI